MSVRNALCRLMDTSDERLAADRAVDRWVPEARDAEYRLNLTRLCRTKHICLRLENDTTFEGRFCLSPERGAEITIRKSDYEANNKQRRVRFTIAHEIGHWIIHEAIGSTRASLFRSPLLSTEEECEEERIADLLAAELLMPLRAMRHFASHPYCHSIIYEGLRAFNVSKLAFMRRYADTADKSVVSINVLPKKFKDPFGGCFVDDAWVVEPPKRLRECRETLRIADEVCHADLGNVADHGLNIVLESRRFAIKLDCEYRIGLVPRATLVGELSDSRVGTAMRTELSDGSSVGATKQG